MQFCGAFHLDVQLSNGIEANNLSYALDNGLSANGAKDAFTPNFYLSKKCAVIHLEFSLPLRLLFVLFADGLLMLCPVSKKGLKQAELIKAEMKLASVDAVCASIASEQQILAVGTKRGVVELYDLADSASLIRSVSLYDWGSVFFSFPS